MGQYAILLAGGSGRRMLSSDNKVFLPLRGIPAIIRALAPFSSLVDGVVIVTRPDEKERVRHLLQGFGMERLVLALVDGGSDRQASVANGLAALPPHDGMVLVHDGARALVTDDIVQRTLASVAAHGSGVAAVPVTDTIKKAGPDGLVEATLDRTTLYAMQTPQGFRLDLLRKAHQWADTHGYRATDDAALLEAAGMPVYLCQGDSENIKLTTPTDLIVAEALLAQRAKREVQA